MDNFPNNFLWGAAISSYQTEGNNFNSDWWEWEQKGKTKDKSGIACDYWNKYKEDHNLAQELGCNAFRLSLEWSRIEPEEGKFSDEAIQHYREILQDLKNRNIKTVVTFWHWTSPLWFQKRYGLNNKKAVDIFYRYGKTIVDRLESLIDIAVVINESMLPLAAGFLAGKFPPGKINPFSYKKASDNLAEAYKKIYKYIKDSNANMQAGVTTLYISFEPKDENSILQKWIVKIAKKFWNENFFEKIKNHVDYYGVDYYIHYKISLVGIRKKGMLTDMGWEIYPEGLYKSLKEIKEKYELPIYIMENGIAISEDEYRNQFIIDHLKAVEKAIFEGADVKGYFYWSLMDNFEWIYGFDKKFGLVEIDYKTLERKPRKSFYEYQTIIRNNGL